MLQIIKNTIGIVIVSLSLLLAFALMLLAMGGVVSLAVDHSYWTIPALPLGFCASMAAWALHVNIVAWAVSWTNGY